jgi:hypothetical protein
LQLASSGLRSNRRDVVLQFGVERHCPPLCRGRVCVPTAEIVLPSRNCSCFSIRLLARLK